MPKLWANKTRGLRQAALALLIAAPGLAIPATAGATPAQAETVSVDDLTIADLRALAPRALAAGDLQLADALARELLKRHPDDRTALLVLTLTAPSRGDGREGMKAGARAYSLAKNDAERFEAARLTARSAFVSGAHVRSQFWLRRAMLSAHTDAQRSLTAKDYRLVRSKNPLRFDIRFTASRSDNLNGGASSNLIQIDGLDAVGYLSGSAQALSGTEAWARGMIGYTLSESASQRTRLQALVSLREVRLSDAARALAPDVRNGHLRARILDLSLRHERTVRPDTALSLAFGIGQQTYGGELASRSATLELGLDYRLNQRIALGLSAEVEARRLGPSGDASETVARLTASQRMALGKGSVGLSFSLREIESDKPNNRSNSVELVADWQPGRLIGPVALGFSLGVGQANYGDYTLGPIVVPGGREDRTVFGTVEVTPSGYGVGGFVPVLRMIASETDSNVSRFDSRQVLFQLGIKSAF